jgi:histidinol-phosphate aminotransferase
MAPALELPLLDLRGVGGDLGSRIPRPGPLPEGPVAAVRAIVADVRARGDEALYELTERFDGVRPATLRVPQDEVAAAVGLVPAELLASLRYARDAIEAYHRHRAPRKGSFRGAGVTVHDLPSPVDRAGLYAPGGRARYPSTVLMTAVPARVAGVRAIALCVPPGPDGQVAPVVLAAAALAGVDEVYRVGGAQAIAALAYGTASIRPVDVIAGPGNRYVSLAQREVAGVVGVPASFAGPSEVVVVADGSTPADYAAMDLLVQAEHGPDGLAWLVTWSEEAARRIGAAVTRLLASAARREEIESTLAGGGHIVLVDGPAEAMEVANAIAPEHLELCVADPHALLPLVRHAGAVFLGHDAPASVGDYVAGPSHVLPTFGSARYASALGVEDFVRRMHAVEVDAGGIALLAPHVAALATAEGLACHAASVTIRAEAAPATARADAPSGASSRLPAGYHSPQLDVEVRLNTNESPEPPPAAFTADLAAAIAAAGDLNRYPDREARALREALAGLHGVEPDQVFCANGSNEVLQILLLAFAGAGRTVALFEPTYALHSHVAKLVGSQLIVGERDEDLLVGDAEADRIASLRPDVTMLCSPNNPTGQVEPRSTLERLLAGTAGTAGLVVVDEAYGHFGGWSAVDLVPGGATGLAGPVVVRTFSKAWALAGLRLGYAIAAPAVVEALFAAALPYHVDALKQLAGRLALGHAAEAAAGVERIVAGRRRLLEGLALLPVQTWPSDANFVLFRPLARDGHDVWQGLVQRSVLVRELATWPRLAGCLRVTVGTPAECERFLAALAEVLG